MDLIDQVSVADPYSWSYKVTTNDNNYNDRHDKKFDLLDYDWDQNREIEDWYQSLLKNPSKHKKKVEMENSIVGDQNCVKNGAHYKIYCEDDDVIGNSTLSAEPGNKRFFQVNTKTTFVRPIARCDRPCVFKRPQ